MGGHGSGRSEALAIDRRRCVDECDEVIDVRAWQRRGHLTAGHTFAWGLPWFGRLRSVLREPGPPDLSGRLAASLLAPDPLVVCVVGDETGRVVAEVEIRHVWQGDPPDRAGPHTDFLRIEHVAGGCGGARPYLVCPKCERRREKLYLTPLASERRAAGVSFHCRACLGIAYRSQRRRTALRALDRAKSLRLHVGGVLGAGRSIMDPFPERGPGMHRRTYARLRAAYAQNLSLWNAHAQTEHVGVVRWIEGMRRQRERQEGRDRRDRRDRRDLPG